MKKKYMIPSAILIAVFVLSLNIGCATTGSKADPNKASKEECVAKCRQAAELIKKVGLDAVIAKINDKTGSFVWKDTYVYCIDDQECKVLAHPNPKYIGFKLKKWRNADGKQPFMELLETAKTKDDGWISYNMAKLGESKPSPKTVYFLKVPGEKVFVCAGIYE